MGDSLRDPPPTSDTDDGERGETIEIRVRDSTYVAALWRGTAPRVTGQTDDA